MAYFDVMTGFPVSLSSVSLATLATLPPLLATFLLSSNPYGFEV